MEFGEGLLNKGKAKKREKRPLTQIEIMAAVEREKQEKKAARRAAKVRASPIRLPSQHETRASDFRDFSPSFCFSERHFVSLCPFVKKSTKFTSRDSPRRFPTSRRHRSWRTLRKPRLRRERSAWISS